ncbi:MAG: FecR domain-containing protein [Planctomycetes bacterium]|nr:FecR domain-containing protein [Planctomycetota bacterium]
MSIVAELDALLNRLVDDQLDEAGTSRLQEVLRGDAVARRRYRHVMALHAGLQWDYVAAARESLPSTGNSARWWLPWAGALAASLLVAVSAVLWSLSAPAPLLTTVSANNGSLIWSDGRTRRVLTGGEAVPAGRLTLEGDSATAVLRFHDGTSLTLASDSDLNVMAKSGAKHLHLQRGIMSAEVSPQPVGRPMVIQTATARLEVLGTVFTVSAGTGSTALEVQHGRVRLERLADGQAVEVGEQQQARATLDVSRTLTADLRPQAPTTWRVDFMKRAPTHWSGTWVPPTAEVPGVLRSEPYVAGRTEDGKPIIHHGVRISAPESDSLVFVRLTTASQLSMRFRIVRGIVRGNGAGPLKVMFCAHAAGGAFAGTFFATIDPLEYAADADGWRTAVVPMSAFIPSRPEVHATLNDRTLSLILPNTIQRNVGLEVAALAVEIP